MQESLGFQLAPMLDVVFLLLIFFIVTQTFSLTEQDLDVKVPSADQSSKDKSRAFNEIIVNVRQDGSIIINGERYSLDALQGIMGRMVMAGGGATPVLIRGDAECKYQNIIDVVDECMKAKIYNIRFSTSKKKQPDAPTTVPAGVS